MSEGASLGRVHGAGGSEADSFSFGNRIGTGCDGHGKGCQRLGGCFGVTGNVGVHGGP